MTAPDEPRNGNDRGNLREQFTRWLFSQGASTVLLTLILGFLGYGATWLIPELLQKQREELKQTRDDFRISLTEQRKDFLEHLKRDDRRNVAHNDL